MAANSASDHRDLAIRALCTKSCMKQDVFARTKELFQWIKEVVEEVSGDLAEEVRTKDDRLVVAYADRSSTTCELKVAGDILIFNMHTNVFRLDPSHNLWRTSYLGEDEMRGYFGMVNVYNFLSDSMLYDRDRDVGYLVARIFLNKEGHYFMQGKRQLGFLHNSLQESVMDRTVLKDMVYAMVDHVIGFDLLAPPFGQVDQMTVSEVKALFANQQMSTGKRLGFRFQADIDEVN